MLVPDKEHPNNKFVASLWVAFWDLSHLLYGFDDLYIELLILEKKTLSVEYFCPLRRKKLTSLIFFFR